MAKLGRMTRRAELYLLRVLAMSGSGDIGMGRDSGLGAEAGVAGRMRGLESGVGTVLCQ
jgi:hypothetical protein